jgi:hypothetical protein
MRCAFDPEGARLAVARLTGFYLFRVRRQEIADENPRCPADRLGVTREGRTHRCGDGTELAESGLKILDIPAAMNSEAGPSPKSSRDSPRNQSQLFVAARRPPIRGEASGRLNIQVSA